MDILEQGKLNHLKDQYQQAYNILGRAIMVDQLRFQNDVVTKCQKQLEVLESVSAPPGSREVLKLIDELEYHKLTVRALEEVLKDND